MKTLLLRKLYDYISFVRYELPNLSRVIRLSFDEFSDLDKSFKRLMTAIDDEILYREVGKHFNKEDIKSDEET